MKPTTRSLIEYRGEECLNCSTPLDAEDKYCHQCGQLNSTKKLALKDFFGEFFSNMFSYDSRIWRTIKHLLFKPGYVSKEFISGKRLSYANPFRFFLSVCIIFFLMVQTQQFIKSFNDDKTEKATASAPKEEADIDIGNGLFSIKMTDQNNNELTEEELKEIEESSLAGDFVAEQIRSEYAEEIKDVEDSVQTGLNTDSIPEPSLKKEKPLEPLSQSTLDSLGTFDGLLKQTSHYESFITKTNNYDSTSALETMGHDNSKYNRSIYEKMVLMHRISKDGSILADIILPKLPVFLFLFTPLLTLSLWLLYARREFTYMEHLIFAFNTLTFIFLSFILIFIVKWISFGYVNLTQFFFWFIGPFYLYKAMRNFYGQRRLKTLLKFLFVSFTFVIGLSIGMSFLLLIGIAVH